MYPWSDVEIATHFLIISTLRIQYRLKIAKITPISKPSMIKSQLQYCPQPQDLAKLQKLAGSHLESQQMHKYGYRG